MLKSEIIDYLDQAFTDGEEIGLADLEVMFAQHSEHNHHNDLLGG